MSFERFSSAFARMACAGLAAALIAAAAAVPSAEAQERRLTDDQRAQLEQYLEQVRARLNLSEEQRAQIEPALRRSFEERAEILQRYGVGRDESQRPGFREARAMKSDLEEARKNNDAEVEKILDDRQMAEYRKIQEEMREQIRQRMRERRS